jgi:hypothetical protein
LAGRSRTCRSSTATRKPCRPATIPLSSGDQEAVVYQLIIGYSRTSYHNVKFATVNINDIKLNEFIGIKFEFAEFNQ